MSEKKACRPPSPGTGLPRHDSGLAMMSDADSTSYSTSITTASQPSTPAPSSPHLKPSTTSTPTSSSAPIDSQIVFNMTPFSPTATRTSISLPHWLAEVREEGNACGCTRGREWVVRARTPLSWEEKMALRPRMRNDIRWGVTPSVVPRKQQGGADGGNELTLSRTVSSRMNGRGPAGCERR